MKLIIEIPEKRFKDIQRIASVQLDMRTDTVEQIIANATPLPKGHWIKVNNPDVNAWTGGHKCSECGRECVQMSMSFCANCGADMRESEVEE